MAISNLIVPDTSNIPLLIFLQYENNLLKFQVNPERLGKDIPSKGKGSEVVGLGEVNAPQTPSLATLSIQSFFWQDKNILPTALYVAWLEKWQASKKPAKFIVTRLNYSMYVTCERFYHEKRAGEEEDVYYELDLKEYRPYGAKRIGVKPTPKSLFEKYSSLGSDAINFVPILIDIPTPSRTSTMKSGVNPYVTKEGDTVASISRKVFGTSSKWRVLYDANEAILSDYIAENKEIPAGTKLTIPLEYL